MSMVSVVGGEVANPATSFLLRAVVVVVSGVVTMDSVVFFRRAARVVKVTVH